MKWKIKATIIQMFQTTNQPWSSHCIPPFFQRNSWWHFPWNFPVNSPLQFGKNWEMSSIINQICSVISLHNLHMSISPKTTQKSIDFTQNLHLFPGFGATSPGRERRNARCSSCRWPTTAPVSARGKWLVALGKLAENQPFVSTIFHGFSHGFAQWWKI
jgi:hypothetical protein